MAANEAKQAIGNTGTTLEQHLNDYVRHITDEERALWNDKAGSGDVQAILQQANNYTDQQVDTSKGEAKEYTDEQISLLLLVIEELQLKTADLEERVSILESPTKTE